jgi:ABC-type cobalamin transport system permease subunit
MLFLAIVCIISHSFCFFSESNGRQCILEMWNLKAAILCSIGWLEWKLVVVSVVVDFLYMSISRFVWLRVIFKSRKFMELCFVCGVKFYLVMSLICVCVDGLGLDFYYVIYDQDIINIPRV